MKKRIKQTIILCIIVSISSCAEMVTPLVDYVLDEIKIYQCVNPGCKLTVESITEMTVCPKCHADMLELTRENF